jgi:hypothetical protein
MGKMKEQLMDIMEYAEDCCGFALCDEEALRMFEAVYPGNDELFWEAWNNWLSFAEYIQQQE